MANPKAPVASAVFANEPVDGARAVEVAAMLDDSIVVVRHVMNPRGGKVTRMTWALFAAGVGLLLMAAVGFAQGVSNARFNKAALHEWTEARGKAMHDYRPRQISLGFDWMAFGGLGGGILALTLGLIRLRDERDQPLFRIGTDPEVEFPTADSPASSFALVAPAGDGFVFNFAQGMEGELIDAAGNATPLAELASLGATRPSSTAPGAHEVPIPFDGRFRVTSGNNTFMVSSVARPRRHVEPLLASLETGALAFFACSAVLHLGFLALLWNIPPDPKTLSMGELGDSSRLARVQSAPLEEPAPPEIEVEKTNDQEKPGGTGTKMAMTEGKMGTPDSARIAGQYAMKKNHEGDPQLARKRALQMARRSGVLGAFQAQPGGQFASLTGTGDYSSGLDNRDIYGGLIGSEVGGMHSDVFGYGIRGTGPGGGGTGWGTIGTGVYGTIGHGDGTGSGYDVGSGNGGRPGTHVARAPGVDIGPVDTDGELDKKIIRRHIRKKIDQIKYCYEKQLLVKPTLEGTVLASFTINGRGAVIAVHTKGLGDTGVEQCVAATVKSIQFPAPKGGGLVNVRYPFIFRPAGG